MGVVDCRLVTASLTASVLFPFRLVPIQSHFAHHTETSFRSHWPVLNFTPSCLKAMSHYATNFLGVLCLSHECQVSVFGLEQFLLFAVHGDICLLRLDFGFRFAQQEFSLVLFELLFKAQVGTDSFTYSLHKVKGSSEVRKQLFHAIGYDEGG